MLRARNGAVSGCESATIAHDASPEAIAESRLKEPNGHATGEPGGDLKARLGTGNTQEPVAWGVMRVGGGRVHKAVEAAARIIDAYEEEMDGLPSGAVARLRNLLERTK